MGAKSTDVLKRETAEELYVTLREKSLRRKLRAEAVAMDNTELERELERMGDEDNMLRNYLISEHEGR
jgi:hypothetical protein